MRMAIRHYDVEIVTEGLVHIGDGSAYSKKDYFADGNKISVLDAARFIGQLNNEQFAAYCRFLETSSQDGLQDFLERDKTVYAAAQKAVLYQVDLKLAKARRGTYQYFNVAAFTKDAYGAPCVPGSSVKGMLRTAILTALIDNDQESYKKLYDGESRELATNAEKNADNAIQKEAFWKEQPDKKDRPEVFNDIMRYISVSDSKPLSAQDLTFAKKYDKFARWDNGNHKKDLGKISREEEYYGGNALNIYRECLKPKTRIELAIDIDDYIDTYLPWPLDAEGLSSVLHTSYDLYKRCFLDQFDAEETRESSSRTTNGVVQCSYVYTEGWLEGMRCKKHAVDGTNYCADHKDAVVQTAPAEGTLTCYLGGSVDFDSKTVINALFDDDQERLSELAQILYCQFPTKIDSQIHPELWREVERAGFKPRAMKVDYKKDGRVNKAKDDHRHWRDVALGVSPHTLKLGIIGDKKYPMGKCSIQIKDRS